MLLLYSAKFGFDSIERSDLFLFINWIK